MHSFNNRLQLQLNVLEVTYVTVSAASALILTLDYPQQILLAAVY